ncbi:unnamed protein product [Haemonchus placei]|uniref:Uncharacterized protein n=1 Tax=Haemonchus placei TaxID=6290 RepID=A0A0N4VYG9_HAEPC|nr:unnamed protein product [Haemonchus placei]
MWPRFQATSSKPPIHRRRLLERLMSSCPARIQVE